MRGKRAGNKEKKKSGEKEREMKVEREKQTNQHHVYIVFNLCIPCSPYVLYTFVFVCV